MSRRLDEGDEPTDQAQPLGELEQSSVTVPDPPIDWSEVTEVLDEGLPAGVANMEACADDKNPFTLVTYRKNRPNGIPVVFKPLQAGASFWKVNPKRRYPGIGSTRMAVCASMCLPRELSAT